MTFARVLTMSFNHVHNCIPLSMYTVARVVQQSYGLCEYFEISRQENGSNLLALRLIMSGNGNVGQVTKNNCGGQHLPGRI